VNYENNKKGSLLHRVHRSDRRKCRPSGLNHAQLISVGLLLSQSAAAVRYRAKKRPYSLWPLSIVQVR